ncbi:MAG TPA: site-2 protease family protein [Acidobacteriota bacterium]|nr:site-2 protease family protein [Acidobacteriota bacterium]
MRIAGASGSIPLFKISGIPVEVNYSWILIFVLISINLGSGWFPATLPQIKTSFSYVLGAIAAILLFVCVLAHELSHSLVARKEGLHVHGIILHVFGGVSLIHEGKYKPSVEFKVAIAGPLLSIFLGAVFLVARKTLFNESHSIANALFTYLFLINFMLAIFNLFPGFPLDGGRLLRAVLVWWKKDLLVATKIAARVGVGIAFLLMIYGAVTILRGNLGGFWTILIGIFVKDAAESSYKQMLLSQRVEGKLVNDIMQKNPVIIPPDITVQNLIDDYFWRYQYGSFPVGDTHALGIVPFTEVKKIPPEARTSITVREIMHPTKEALQIAPDKTILEAFEKARTNGVGRLIVTNAAGEILGYLSLRDIARAFQEKTN